MVVVEYRTTDPDGVQRVTNRLNFPSVGAESVIIIKNAKGKEVVRITRGYVTVKNFNVEEIVQIMRGVVSVKTMAGKEMVHVEKGEIYIEDFDGEVIVNNLADVNKLDEEMSLKNL